MTRNPFVLPVGLLMRQDSTGLVVEYDGDIELNADIGGRIAALRSLGGNVILNASLEVGEIKAAGTLRAPGDVSARRIEAGSIQVGGDLRATSLSTTGEIRCGGDLDAEDLRAGRVESNALRVAAFEASGEIETTGETRLGRGRAAALRCGGDLQVDELTLSGELATVGMATLGALSADSASIGGDLSVGRGELAGNLSVGGGLSGTGVEVGGDLQVEGAVAMDAVQVSGRTKARSLTARTLSGAGGVSAETIEGRDTVQIGGDIRASRIDGGDIRIGEGNVDVRIIVGSRSAHLGAISIKSDIVMAPTVTVEGSASGRISVLESGTEPGTSRIKGCLSLEDLEELFGNSKQFLSDRGLADPGYGPRKAGSAPPPPPLPATAKAAGTNKSAPKVEVAPAPVPQPEPELEVEVEVDDPGDSMLASVSPVHPEVQEAIEAGDDRTLDDILDRDPDGSTNGADHGSALDSLIELSNVSELDSLVDGKAAIRIQPSVQAAVQVQAEGEDDLFGWADQMLTQATAGNAGNVNDIDIEIPTGGVEPLLEVEVEPELTPEPEPEPPAPQEDPIHGQIQETVSKIVTCYLHTEMPPAVTRLKDLVEARDYGRVRSDITEIWNQLLKFHQKRGMRIQPQVTTTFNTINSLVRKL